MKGNSFGFNPRSDIAPPFPVCCFIFFWLLPLSEFLWLEEFWIEFLNPRLVHIQCNKCATLGHMYLPVFQQIGRVFFYKVSKKANKSNLLNARVSYLFETAAEAVSEIILSPIKITVKLLQERRSYQYVFETFDGANPDL